MDAGIATEDNLKMLRGKHYVMVQDDGKDNGYLH